MHLVHGIMLISFPNGIQLTKLEIEMQFLYLEYFFCYRWPLLNNDCRSTQLFYGEIMHDW